MLMAAGQVLPRGGALVFIGFVPLCMAIRPHRFFKTWFLLALTNAIYTVFTLMWICRLGPGYRWILALTALYAGACTIIPAMCCSAARDSSPVRLLLLPLGWGLMELIARCTGLRVTWALLGLPLADWTSLAKASAFAGPELLSYAVLAVNVAIALWLLKEPWRWRCAGLALGPGVLGIMLIGGFVCARDRHGDVPVLRVTMVQPNLAPELKWSPLERRPMLDRLDRLIDGTLLRDPDIILLPETALAGFVRYEDDLTEWVKSTVARVNRPLLFGSLDRSPDSSKVFNVAIMITPFNTVTIYRKTRLVPVAEYVPRALSGIVQNLRGERILATPGSGPERFELRQGIVLSSLICYEDIFPDLARNSAQVGADALVALINTQQFLGTSQVLSHLRRAQLTAASAGLPLIRCTNSGISCVIDCHGRVTGVLRDPQGRDTDFEGAGFSLVAIRQVNTPYRRCGDLLPLALLGLPVLASAVVSWRRKRGSTRPV